jgi:RNA polymerase sigma-70 factor (ECF subfamily)
VSPAPQQVIRQRAEAIYRAESRRVLATLIRLLGDFELAEEALQDAFTAAMAQWPQEGLPRSPRAWLVSAGRFRAIDTIRRRARFDAAAQRIAEQIDTVAQPADVDDDDAIGDDRLRLIFTCCHPALSRDARIALTLRTVCDLTTEAIASAFLSPVSTVAQRIVRAKAKIRDAAIPYVVPGPDELPERLDSVLQVVYLVFNEGYAASEGDTHTRGDLCSEAIRLGRLLVELMPDAEVLGLLALMLLQDARRAARENDDGEPVPLDEQDRSLWDQEQIAEGAALVHRALSTQRFGPYALQAAIAAVHAEAPSPADTDWQEIVGLYDVLLRIDPSPVVALNRAAAVATRDGPAAGLALIEALLDAGELADYAPAHIARAELCRRLERVEPAHAAYERALALTGQAAQKRLLERRLRELGS